MKGYEVIVTVTIPDVEADDEDDAINFVTEAIEDGFAQRVSFDNQRATAYSGKDDEHERERTLCHRG